MTVDLEIICVGNELLIGKVLNTNAHWLSKEATELAVNVKRVTVIQDIISEIVAAIQEALARKPRFIITTGGLGPTFDDKTLEGVAKALNRELTVNPEAQEMVQQRCNQYAKKRGLPTPVELTKPRIKMAVLPKNTIVVNNPIGSAPGVEIDLPCTTIFVLPGVPSEMEAIYKETIAPKLKEATGDLIFCDRSMFLEGIAEATLAPFIDQVMATHEGVYIKSHPLGINLENKPCIELHLTLTADERNNPQAMLDDSVEMLKQIISVFSGVVIRLK
ncbi:MAG: molybdopterin-binding protein [Candidatus Bathyarchaeia archaeon]